MVPYKAQKLGKRTFHLFLTVICSSKTNEDLNILKNNKMCYIFILCTVLGNYYIHIRMESII